MPYQHASDEKLPDNVKKMSEARRKAFVAAFNSVMDGCKNKDCEHRAFAVAYHAAEQVK